MKEINEKATSILLAQLDKEIDIKCMELKEMRAREKQKNFFFIGCLVILAIFFLQIVFSIFNVGYIATIIIYQIISLIIVVSIILGISKGERHNDKVRKVSRYN